jgi:hypothetical protein
MSGTVKGVQDDFKGLFGSLGIKLGLTAVIIAYGVTFLVLVGWVFPPRSGEDITVGGNSANLVYYDTHSKWQAYVKNDTGTYFFPGYDEYCFNWGNTDWEDEAKAGVAGNDIDYYKWTHADGAVVVPGVPVVGSSRQDRVDDGKLAVQCYLSQTTNDDSPHKINMNALLLSLVLVPMIIALFTVMTDDGKDDGKDKGGMTGNRISYLDHNNHLIRMVIYPIMSFMCAYYVGEVSWNAHLAYAMFGFAVAFAGFVYSVM